VVASLFLSFLVRRRWWPSSRRKMLMKMKKNS